MLALLFPAINIGIIPVPVPKSTTLALFFTFAKLANNTASIPKQNPVLSCINFNPLLEQIKIEFNDKTIKTCLAEEVKVLHVPKKCENGCCGGGKCKHDDIDSETLKELRKLED